MIKNRTSLHVVLVGLALLGLLVACSVDEEVADVPATTPTEQPAEAAERETPPPPVVTPPKSPSASGGISPSEQLRERVELPDSYPSDAPVYPGTEPSQVSKNSKGRMTATFGTDDSPEKVMEYMVGYLPGAGWSLLGQHDIPGGQLVQATKGERLVSVLVSRVEEGRETAITLIAISVDS